MALIECPECGKMFSDKAAACPECGCPTAEIVRGGPVAAFDDVFKAGRAMALLNKGAIKKVKGLITEDESVLYASVLDISAKSGAGNGECGVFTVTDRRVLFVSSLLGIGSIKGITARNITSVDCEAWYTASIIRINGMTETLAVICPRKERDKILDALSRMRR